MSKLATNKQLVDRLDIQEKDDQQILLRVESALLSATAHMARLLRTEFDRRTLVDTWWLSDEEFPHHRHRTQLRLTRGFVDPDETFELRLDPILNQIQDQDAIQSELVRLGAERGTVVITTTDSRRPLFRPFILRDRTYAQVNYTAGFKTKVDTTAPKNCPAKVYRKVPEWLEEGALQMAREIYLVDVESEAVIAAASTGGRNARNVRNLGTILTTFETQLSTHIRFLPSWQAPLYEAEDFVVTP